MGLRFLDFPAELRLEIYRWILLDNIIDRGPRLLRGPDPKPTVHTVTAKAPGGADTDDASGTWPTTSSGSSGSALLDHNRKVGRLPTALLLTCKKIYLEARVVPFNEGGFWCGKRACLGLVTARAFFGRLAPWQRDSTRFVVLDTFNYSDLSRPTRPTQEELIRQGRRGGGGGGGDDLPRLNSWSYGPIDDRDLIADPMDALKEICGYWSAGVQNLRLRIITFPGQMYYPIEVADGVFLGTGRTRKHRSTLPRADEWLLLEPVVTGETTRPLPWIDVALRQLRALRRLEVDLLERMRLSPADKVTWCARLEEMLNRQEERQHRVAVVPVVETAKLHPAHLRTVLGGLDL